MVEVTSVVPLEGSPDRSNLGVEGRLSGSQSLGSLSDGRSERVPSVLLVWEASVKNE
jgi:hypothetical protein